MQSASRGTVPEFRPLPAHKSAGAKIANRLLATIMASMGEPEEQPCDISSIPTEELRERVRIFLEAVDVLLAEINGRREAAEAGNDSNLDDLPSIPIIDAREIPDAKSWPDAGP